MYCTGVSQRRNSLCNITTIDMSQLYWKLLHTDHCRHDSSVTLSKKTSCSYCETVKKAAVYFSNTLLNICHNIQCHIPRIPEYGNLQLILNRHSRTWLKSVALGTRPSALIVNRLQIWTILHSLLFQLRTSLN